LAGSPIPIIFAYSNGFTAFPRVFETCSEMSGTA
jgi:hypothetical protein